jgi:hypothetical protein
VNLPDAEPWEVIAERGWRGKFYGLEAGRFVGGNKRVVRRDFE